MRNRIIIAGVIIVFLAAFIFWGTGFIYDVTWARSSNEREDLATQIENAKAALEKVPEIDSTLQYQLEELQSQLEYEMTVLPADIYIPGFIETMLTIADDNGITIVPLRTIDWSAASGGYEKYQVQVLVTGDANNIAGFITTLENGDINSVVTTSLKLDGDDIGDKDHPSAAQGTLTIAMYRR